MSNNPTVFGPSLLPCGYHDFWLHLSNCFLKRFLTDQWSQLNDMNVELIRLDSAGEPVEDWTPISIGEITTIGRNPGNTVILDYDLVSRNHAMIRKEFAQFILMDLGSANGTFVNNQPISSPTVLNDTDEIKFGDVKFSIRYATSDASDEPDTPVRKTTMRVFADIKIAVLVSDIRNYTNLSESIPADKFSSVLADWFRLVGDCINKRSGVIEGFRGDSVLAYWASRPAGGTEHILEALNTAKDMVAASRNFDVKFSQEHPGHKFKIGCGLHIGDAVLGNIGADSRRDFTALGDCVNITFRIESQCSSLDREILVSEDITLLSSDNFEFEDMGYHELKGKSEPYHLFAL